MAFTCLRGHDGVQIAIVAAIQSLRQNAATTASQFHCDVTSTTSGDYSAPVATPLLVSAAAATNLATSITLANNIKGVLNVHFADGVAHKAADTVAAISAADASDRSYRERD